MAKKAPTRRLTHPARDLWREVTNDQASWTDALFWYVLGAMSIASIWIVSSMQ